ncbi:hypothetical protein B0H11DRAFT_2052962 [Mycena galericulata]|nr:hypothetical protein B0H11DRAFT_2052962 [Mycena galericulata]
MTWGAERVSQRTFLRFLCSPGPLALLLLWMNRLVPVIHPLSPRLESPMCWDSVGNYLYCKHGLAPVRLEMIRSSMILFA